MGGMVVTLFPMNRIGFWNVRGIDKVEKQRKYICLCKFLMSACLASWRQRLSEKKLIEQLVISILDGHLYINWLRIQKVGYGWYGSHISLMLIEQW